MRAAIGASLAVVTLVGFTACSSSDDDSTNGDAGGDGANACTFQGAAEPEAPAPPTHTPRWALLPWISKDISTRDDTYAFVDGFQSRDIPVGVVVLDSPWETNYNTLLPNPSRYGDFGGMVSDMKARGVRVVLWITQMVNESSFDLEEGGDKYDGESPNWFEGQDCHFFVDDGQGFGWWKGTGSGVDFFDGRARAWWHAQQNTVLDLGISGWKLDFGEEYIDSDPIKTAMGDVPHQQYSERYYQDYLTYGVGRRGKDEFVTMVRGWDESYSFPGRFYARKEHAPVVWAGDNRRDWIGLKDALDEILRSAKAGYVVVGSDVGGYLDRDDKTFAVIPPDTLTFARWTAISAIGPFMQLHGRANLTPWTVVDHVDETVALYRWWSKLHAAMVPFFYSLAEEAYANGGSMIHPVGDDSTAWADDYRFMLGDAFLVAPIVDATGKRDVPLPGMGAYYDFWNPTAPPYVGGTTITAYDSTARDRIPIFVHEGAIVPLDVVDDANGLGTAASKGKRTVLVWPGSGSTTFVLHEDDDTNTTLATTRSVALGSVTLSRAPKPVLLRVHVDAAPTAIDAGAGDLPRLADRAAFDAAATGWFHEPSTSSAWVSLPASAAPLTVTIR